MATTPTRRRLEVILRDGETVSPLELFFDLVFVLAITQCTALMASDPTWAGIGRGLVVLGLLWWTWVGYAWLTSVLDPEEGAVRLVLFVAMAALLVISLCVLVALALKQTLAHLGDPLEWEPAAALVGGASLYLLAHVAFKYRGIQKLSRPRLVVAVALPVLIPVAHRADALVTLGLVTAVIWGLLAFEARRHAEARQEIRHAGHNHQPA